MKKILLSLFIVLFLLTGCNNLMNTPTKKVELLLGKYQKLDDEVLTQLGDSLLSDTVLTKEEKEKYQELLKRQYKNLTYTVKNEAIDGKTAMVEVEIEVYDYNKAITSSEEYLLNNQSEFQDETGNINTVKYNDYKLNEIEKMKDRITYTINFTLSKIDEDWMVDDLTDTERQKIHGLYARDTILRTNSTQYNNITK